MKVSIISYSVVILLLSLLIGCGDTPTGPRQESGGNLLPNGNFEKNGEPTLEGWQATSEDSANLTEDAPPNGGKWSLFRETEWLPAPLGLLSEPLTGFQNNDILRLSGFVRAVGVYGGGYIGLLVGSGSNRSMSKIITTSEAEWTFLSFDDTLLVTERDSIWVVLDALSTEIAEDPTGALFDLISLEKLK